MRRLIAAAVLTIVPTMVQAADGNMLRDICKTGNAIFYVTGVLDTLHFTQQSEKVCVPKAVTGAQLRDVVCKAIIDNPQSRHRPAVALTYEALKAGFPCSAR